MDDAMKYRVVMEVRFEAADDDAAKRQARGIADAATNVADKDALVYRLEEMPPGEKPRYVSTRPA